MENLTKESFVYLLRPNLVEIFLDIPITKKANVKFQEEIFYMITQEPLLKQYNDDFTKEFAYK